MKALKPDLCIIGAGSGGLSLAYASSQLGLSTVLLECAKMGGDCLNHGCVPSKALIAAAHSAQVMRDCGHFGITPHEPEVDIKKVMGHVHGVIESVAIHDSVERYTNLGCQVIESAGRFTSRREVVAGDFKIRARHFVLATGSGPAVPPIPGLKESSYLTNENIFELKVLPEHLIVLGGGAIGMEMAQSFRRLGSRVSLIEMFTVMPRDDAELVAVIRERMQKEGVTFYEQAGAKSVEEAAGKITVNFDRDGKPGKIEGSHLLVAAGRVPHLANLGLEEAGIAFDRTGVQVKPSLRTTNSRVSAIGDVAGPPQFTHKAGYDAGILVQNLLLRLPVKANYDFIPAATYTDPEVAQVGLTEQAARDRFDDGKVNVASWKFDGNDRAVAERDTEGMVKLILGPKDRIVGAGIVGARAGEMLAALIPTVKSRAKISSLTGMVLPYPTRSEAIKRAAGAYLSPKFFSPPVRRIVRLFSKL